MRNLDFFKKKSTTGGTAALTAALFFTDNNLNGYFSKEEFTNYLGGFDQTDAIHFDRSVEAASDGANLNSQLKPSTDKMDGSPILWLRFAHAKQQFPVLRIPHHEGMQRFFRDYQIGKITPNFDLDALMVEAGISTEETNNEAPAA